MLLSSDVDVNDVALIIEEFGEDGVVDLDGFGRPALVAFEVDPSGVILQFLS